ncbi:MAG: class I adenylate-forming enzyme family protein [Candidatus Electrothrix sp. GW3-4]|uniref:class I adenylate-forming enzyme family protein n=1 Tax=Candidatus Electrothrix sp. GW3-4 TaxID=3126740 RepID=UPI0030CDC94E
MTDDPQTLDQALCSWAEKTPDKTFIRAYEGNFTFSESQSIVRNLAGFLRKKGLSPGDTVCLLLPRRPELIFSFLAASSIKVLACPINYLESAGHIEQMITSLKPAAIIMDESTVQPEVRTFIQAYKAPAIAVQKTPEHPEATPWLTCIEHPPCPPLAQQPEDGAYLNFTTGSSGFPKGAVCTHAHLYWNTRSAVETFQMTADDVHLCMFASFSHPHELFCRALYTGASLVLLAEISPKAIAKTLIRHRVTCMMGLAVMYKMIGHHCKKLTFPCLRIAESGGMVTDQEIHNNFLNAFGIPILSVWGSTETTGIALANTPDQYRTDGSMGKPCPYYQVRLVDEEGKEIAAGETGELIFSGPAVFSGYHNSTEFPGREGWYYSGDLAQKDEEGFFRFIERKNGMIKVAGLKVYPLQVELVLQQHPAVKEVAVIGVTEKRRGCVPKAFITPEENTVLDMEELESYCRQRLASYMVPREIQLVEALPKIGSGKINKKMLLANPEFPLPAPAL